MYIALHGSLSSLCNRSKLYKLSRDPLSITQYLDYDRLHPLRTVHTSFQTYQSQHKDTIMMLENNHDDGHIPSLSPVDVLPTTEMVASRTTHRS